VQLPIKLIAVEESKSLRGHWTPDVIFAVLYRQSPHLWALNNLWKFFRRACYNQKALYTRMEKMKHLEKIFDLQTRFCSFLVQNSPKEATDLKKVSKVSMTSKIRGF
jgi:hypothetical protein